MDGSGTPSDPDAAPTSKEGVDVGVATSSVSNIGCDESDGGGRGTGTVGGSGIVSIVPVA